MKLHLIKSIAVLAIVAAAAVPAFGARHHHRHRYVHNGHVYYHSGIKHGHRAYW